MAIEFLEVVLRDHMRKVWIRIGREAICLHVFQRSRHILGFDILCLAEAVFRGDLCVFKILELEDMLCSVSILSDVTWCNFTYLLLPLILVVFVLSCESL